MNGLIVCSAGSGMPLFTESFSGANYNMGKTGDDDIQLSSSLFALYQFSILSLQENCQGLSIVRHKGILISFKKNQSYHGGFITILLLDSDFDDCYAERLNCRISQLFELNLHIISNSPRSSVLKSFREELRKYIFMEYERYAI